MIKIYCMKTILIKITEKKREMLHFSLSFISFLLLVAYCFDAGQVDLIKINIIFYHLDYNLHCTLSPRVHQYLEGLS